MIKSAGLLIINKDNEILLCKPTSANMDKIYSIPKGKIEKDESIIDAAIRETFEEIGIKVEKDLIDESKMEVIEYRNNKNKKYKIVYYFPVYMDIKEKVIPEENLQKEEVSWAGFLSKNEAKNKIFWRFDPLLNYI